MLDLEMNFLHLIIVSFIYVKKESIDQVPFIRAFIIYLIATKTIVAFPLYPTASHLLEFSTTLELIC